MAYYGTIRCPKCGRPKGTEHTNGVTCTWCGHTWTLDPPEGTDSPETPRTDAEGTGGDTPQSPYAAEGGLSDST